MLESFTFAEYQQYQPHCQYVAVFQEISVGHLTPDEIYSRLNAHYPNTGFLLEDLNPHSQLQRSLMGFKPLATLQYDPKLSESPITALREFQAQFSYGTRADALEDITASMGVMSYDVVNYLAPVATQLFEPTIPLLLFHIYELSLTYQHATKTLLISTLVASDKPAASAYAAAEQQLKFITDLLMVPANISMQSPASKPAMPVIIEPADPAFIQQIKQAKDYIIAGDAFQIVLSRCFKRPYTVSAFAIYEILRSLNPSPYLFYLPLPNATIVGASPECLVRVYNRQVLINPIAGTRPHQTGQEEQITADLLSDCKELAEHYMLVDLARNDIGAVSMPGSVNVQALLQVKHFSHVSHLTSTITGELHGDHDCWSALAAAFPAGTLSGAPKIRAMQLIAELETTARGLYGGAICRLDLAGNLESCIAIRMAMLQAGVATVRAGAGVVYDSDPLAEARETEQKARAVLEAIRIAEGEPYVTYH